MIEWNPEPLIRNVERITHQELQAEGVAGVREIRSSFGNSKSRPGQPPGIVTGRLRRDVTFEISGSSLFIGVQSRNPYALPLELGAPSRNLRPRPFIAPQKHRSRKRILSRLNKRFSKLKGVRAV